MLKVTLFSLLICLLTQAAIASDRGNIVDISKNLRGAEIDFANKGYLLAAKYKSTNPLLDDDILHNGYFSYCSDRHGSFAINHSLRVNITTFSCFSEIDNVPIFSVLYEKNKVVGMYGIACYSVLAVENTGKLGAKVFADEVLSMDKELHDQGFYSGRMCK